MQTLFYLSLGSIMILNNYGRIKPKIFGPILIEAANSLDYFNSGKVSFYGTIKLGMTDSDYIYIQGAGIHRPQSLSPVYLAVNEQGQVVTTTGGTVEFGNLIAVKESGEFISLGDQDHNFFTFAFDVGDVTLSGINDIVLTASNGGIDLSAESFLNIKGLQVYCGSSDENNIIFDDVSSSNGVFINAQQLELNSLDLRIGNRNLWPNDCSMSNYLMIDCQGYITTYASSANFKTDIEYLDSLPDDYFLFVDDMKAVQFRYLKKNDRERSVGNLSFGFIAEDFHRSDKLKQFVIYDNNMKPMSIDYNSIMVVLLYFFKKKLEKYESLMNLYQEEICQKNKKIISIEKRLEEVEKNIFIVGKNILMNSDKV